MSSIMLPILMAISPETPVSISSKTMVGSFRLVAKMYFRAIINRENSPPDATFLSCWGLMPLLALNKNETASVPSEVGWLV